MAIAAVTSFRLGLLNKKQTMKAKVALNLRGLDSRGQLAKLQTAITKMTGNAAVPSPNPTLPNAQASHDAAKVSLDTIDTKEAELVTLRLQRDALMQTAMDNYDSLGSFVENKSNGDATIITGAGFDVVGARTPADPVSQVLNLVLTEGDNDGTLDAAWDRDPSAKSYEIQTSPDPVAGGSWTFKQIATKSFATITGLTSGARVWVRVRSVGSDENGPWSDPAVKTVP